MLLFFSGARPRSQKCAVPKPRAAEKQKQIGDAARSVHGRLSVVFDCMATAYCPVLVSKTLPRKAQCLDYARIQPNGAPIPGDAPPVPAKPLDCEPRRLVPRLTAKRSISVICSKFGISVTLMLLKLAQWRGIPSQIRRCLALGGKNICRSS